MNKELIEEGTFEDYISSAREKFLMDIHNQAWNNEMRTAAEDLIICFDQMRERLGDRKFTLDECLKIWDAGSQFGLDPFDTATQHQYFSETFGIDLEKVK